MVRKDGRTYSKDELARQKAYRQLYWRFRNDVHRFEDMLDLLSKQIEDLRKRVRALEGDPE
jgi:hypothetical protein